MNELILQLAASGFGEGLAGMSEAQQEYLIRRAYEEFGKIDLPSLQKIAAEEMGPSAMEGVEADRGLADLERQSLDEIMRVGKGGGRTLADDANLNRLQQKQARTTRSADEAIREQAAARGISGGGNELAMRLANNQGQAQRASDAGLQLNADREGRALQAMMEGGRLAGAQRRNDFDEKSRRAQATDARSRYNADARSRAAMYNAGLPQQHYENQLRRAAGRTQQLGNQANFYGNQAADRRALAAGIGKAGYEAGKSGKSYDEEEGW